MAGSPPLARERPRIPCHTSYSRRITPARAGTTSLSMCSIPTWQDHPRSRGNDQEFHAILRIAVGSPPLARERPLALPCGTFTGRITPARAGTTQVRTGQRNDKEDHPRSRGNDSSSQSPSASISGSPPLARERR